MCTESCRSSDNVTAYFTQRTPVGKIRNGQEPAQFNVFSSCYVWKCRLEEDVSSTVC
jgi:hypothetical protein